VAVYGSTGGGALQVYLDGDPVGGGVYGSNYTPSQPRPDTDLTMMRVASSELAEDSNGISFRRYPYDGSIDELMVFDRALTADEVLAMYQNFELYQP
jgi:hypothetical protein